MASERTETFKTSPIVFSKDGKKLTIHLQQLNEELESYSMKADASDIAVDDDLSRINKATVIVINCYDTNPGGSFDVDQFFDKSLEEKFEAIDGVDSAEVDKGDLIITVFLFHSDVQLVKEYETGGALGPDKEEDVDAYVDNKLKEKPEEIFELLSMTPGYKDEKVKRLE